MFDLRKGVEPGICDRPRLLSAVVWKPGDAERRLRSLAHPLASHDGSVSSAVSLLYLPPACCTHT